MASESLQNFSVQFLKVLVNETKDKNIFYSPLSIMAAFSMLLVGSKNKSAAQLLETFKLNKLTANTVHKEVGELLSKCTTPLGPHDHSKLMIANGLFTTKDSKINETFIKELIEYYKSELKEVNFHDGAAAAKLINRWIENKTNNKIKDMFSDKSLTDLTRLVLANAVYFKDNFKDAFPDNNTSKKPFHRTKDSQDDVDMMLTRGDFDYAEDKVTGTKMLMIPFKNYNLKLLLLLPMHRFGLDECVEKMSASTVHGLVNSAGLRIVSRLELPKFKINTEMDLGRLMPMMGVKDVFDAQEADLSGISCDKLYVDQAIHKTFLEVNEHGVEAAAATAMSISLMCAPMFADETPIEFVVDEPFLVSVYHASAEAVVFFGKIVHP